MTRYDGVLTLRQLLRAPERLAVPLVLLVLLILLIVVLSCANKWWWW